jgi:hypothetical protein
MPKRVKFDESDLVKAAIEEYQQVEFSLMGIGYECIVKVFTMFIL